LTSETFWHAWVERDGRVYDNTGSKISIAKFYKMFQPESVRRYSDTEAMVYAVRTRHHGPWGPDETGDKPRPVRRRK
jgi:hypothetical protein